MPEDSAYDLYELADAADKAGQGQEAIRLAREALRCDYRDAKPDIAAAGHDTLGNYLARYAADFPHALTHHLAGALLLTLTGSANARHCLISVAHDLAQLPSGAIVPASASELSGAVGEVPGVHLGPLLTRLSSDPSAIQDALDALLGQARTWADPDTPLPRHLASWDPVIAGVVAARGGNDEARSAVEEHLAERRQSDDWARLADTLTAILDGRQGTELLEGLDKIDTAITKRALAAVDGDGDPPSQLWPAIPFSGLIARMVNAAWGDASTAAELAQSFIRMGTDSELAPLGDALRRILDGERKPALARDLSPVSAAVVITILFHVPPADRPSLSEPNLDTASIPALLFPHEVHICAGWQRSQPESGRRRALDAPPSWLEPGGRHEFGGVRPQLRLHHQRQ
jgi:hypothetical protein